MGASCATDLQEDILDIFTARADEMHGEDLVEGGFAFFGRKEHVRVVFGRGGGRRVGRYGNQR